MPTLFEPILFEITSASGSHQVKIAEGDLLEAAVASAPSLILADAFFRDRLANIGLPILFIEATEDAKDLAALPALIETCRQHGLARDGRIAGVGGGVVQDITCFIASTYMRGVQWTYLPTTLLAMVDSCIGGKSSINVGAYKNLLGTFYPPAEIVIVPEVLATLPDAHIAAGRAEAAKICFAHGDDAFESYLTLDAGDFGSDPSALIALSLASKKWFIEVDEFDHAERLLLNFGHSFGHALESCSAFALPHGVAVGVGCLAAVEMSRLDHPALKSAGRADRLAQQLGGILRDLAWLGPALDDVNRDAFFRFWDSDKKHSMETYRPILLDDRGFLYRAALPRSAEVAERIWSGFCAARQSLVAAGGSGDSSYF